MAFIAPRKNGFGAARSLDAHRFLMRFASAAVGAFVWIFLFQYYSAFEGTIGRALTETLLLYALCQSITLLVTPFAAARLRGGMRRGIIYGALAFAAALVYGGALLTGAFPRGTAIFAILLGSYRALYRVPYAVERAGSGEPPQPSLAAEVTLALAPLFAGAFVSAGVYGARYGAAGLLFIGAIVALTALLPLTWVPNVHERFSWGYRESFARLFAPENRVVFKSAVARGMGGALLFLILPLGAFFAFGGSYLVLGAFFSMVLFVFLISRSSLRRAPVEEYADGGSYLDEFTALKEMGLACGRLALVLALAITLSFAL